MDIFSNRHEAGIILSKYLKEYINRSDVIVLALPRGGVPVAYEIACALSLPLDVFIVRKLGAPTNPEFAIGAIASGGIVMFHEETILALGLQESAINKVVSFEKKELARREKVYRGNKPFPNLQGKTIILVDDGIATGATIHAAVKALRQYKPKSIVVAVPVSAISTYNEIACLVDKVICPRKPLNFQAVGLWYENFSQISDQEVIDLLEKAKKNIEISYQTFNTKNTKF